MRETLVNYGIGMRVKVFDLLNSVEFIDPKEIYDEITNEDIHIENSENNDLPEMCWEIEDKVKHFDKNENYYFEIIEKFKNNLPETALSRHIIVFVKNLVSEDIMRMDDDKKNFLFNVEDMKYSDEKLEKYRQILNGTIKIFLELWHSY